MAREAGFAEGVAEIVGLEGFERFAALVAAHERDRLISAAECCRMCEHREVQNVQTTSDEASRRTVLGKSKQAE